MKRLQALLKRTSDKRSETLLRFARIVLQAIRSHAVQSDEVDYQNFYRDIEELETRLDTQPDVEALVVAGAVAKALHDYNRRADTTLRLYRAEYETIVARLTQAVAAISCGSAQTIARLKDTHGQLPKAAMLEDIRTVKARLTHCVELLEEEAVRQRREAAENLAAVELHLKQQQASPIAAHPSIGAPATALASRPAIEDAIRSAFLESRRAFAAVFVIERLDVVSERFGSEAGEQIRAAFLDHLKHHLLSTDTIYSWCDPVFVVLLERPYTLARVHGELARTSASRLVKALALQTSSVLLPVSTAWTVIDILESASPSAVYEEIGLFAERHYPADKWPLKEAAGQPASD